ENAEGQKRPTVDALKALARKARRQKRDGQPDERARRHGRKRGEQHHRQLQESKVHDRTSSWAPPARKGPDRRFRWPSILRSRAFVRAVRPHRSATRIHTAAAPSRPITSI